jgi:hypothetical protein
MHGRDDGGRGGGHGGGRNGGRGKVSCQVCGKPGHATLHCYRRFNANYHSEEKVANTASTSYNVDTEWCTDTGAMYHITSELDKLTMREKYGGSDQVHTPSRSDMHISHIDQSSTHTPNRDLILKDVLHVASASKNLLSVHKFTFDNNAFFEIHPWFFLLKNRDTWKPLIHERCRNSLYPLPAAALSKQSINKNVLAAIKSSVARWHYRLGHASSPIV